MTSKASTYRQKTKIIDLTKEDITNYQEVFNQSEKMDKMLSMFKDRANFHRPNYSFNS